MYARIEIKSGSGEYTATSSNENVAVTLIEGNVLFICAKKEGTATINVMDGEKNHAKIDVVNNRFMLDPNPASRNIVLKKGSSWEIPIEDAVKGYEYLFLYADDKSLFESGMIENKIRIKGIKTGETYLSVKQLIWTYAYYHVKIVDVYDLNLWKYTDVFDIQPEQKISIDIMEGNGDYKVTFTEPDIVSANIEPFIENEYIKHTYYSENQNTLKIKGLKSGNTTITITDREGKSDVVKVRVN